MQLCQLFHKRASLGKGLFFLPWCTCCTLDLECPHNLFSGCKIILFLFSIILVSIFFGMHSGQEDNSFVFLWSNGKLSEIICMVKCVLNCFFICFRQKAGWNARFVLFHRANQSELSGLHLHGQRNWPIIIVSGNVSACSRTDGTKSRTAWVGTGNPGAWVPPPVEILEETKKNVLLSARTYTLIPYLLGSFGSYCLKLRLPLNPWRDSSTVQPVPRV